MVKPKQTSEDKLHLFHQLVLNSDSFFGSKELEKLAEKAGFRCMQVKDAVKMLLDENLINTDKVASSSVFWALKSQAFIEKENELKALRAQHSKLVAIDISMESLESIQKRQREVDEKLMESDILEDRLKELEKEEKVYSVTNPKHQEELMMEIDYAKNAIRRWSDNIEILRGFTKKRLCIPQEQVDKLLDLPPDWESVVDFPSPSMD